MYPNKKITRLTVESNTFLKLVFWCKLKTRPENTDRSTREVNGFFSYMIDWCIRLKVKSGIYSNIQIEMFVVRMTNFEMKTFIAVYKMIFYPIEVIISVRDVF